MFTPGNPGGQTQSAGKFTPAGRLPVALAGENGVSAVMQDTAIDDVSRELLYL
jgi:hypothetical protein